MYILKHNKYSLVLFILIGIFLPSLLLAGLSGEDDRIDLLKHQDHPLFSQLSKSVYKLEIDCTGVAISKKLFLTAGHCAHETLIARQYSSEYEYKKVNLKLLFYLYVHPFVDFALYEIEKGEFENFIPIDSSFEIENISKDDEFYIAGFPVMGPRRGNFLLKKTTLLKYEDPGMFSYRTRNKDVINGSVSPAHASYNKKVGLISFASDIFNGDSGAPLLLARKIKDKIKLFVIGTISLGGTGYEKSDVHNTQANSISTIRDYLSTFDPSLLSKLSLQANNSFELPQGFWSGRPAAYSYGNSDFLYGSINGYINNAILQDITIEGANVWLDILNNCYFKNVKFKNAAISSSDFSSCKFENVSFEKVVYSNTVKWPKDLKKPATGLIGPFLSSSEEVEQPFEKKFEGLNLDGIYIPTFFKLYETSFKNSSLKGAFIEQYLPIFNISFNDVDLESASIYSNSEKYSFRGANIKGANIIARVHKSYNNNIFSHPKFSKAKVNSFTNILNISTPLLHRDFFKDEDAIPTSTNAGIYFVKARPISQEFNSPYSEAYENYAGPKEWGPEEIELVKKYFSEWVQDFPQFIGALDGGRIRFNRVKAIPVFLANAPHVEPDIKSTSTSPVYFSSGPNDYSATIDIIITDEVFKNYAINGIGLSALRLFHALSRARDWMLFEKIPDFDEFRDIYCDEHRHPKSFVKEAYSKYTDLIKKDKINDALQFGYEFAKQHGMPSIESMLCEKEITYAEILAYAALDPNFSKYAHQIVKEIAARVIVDLEEMRKRCFIEQLF